MYTLTNFIDLKVNNKLSVSIIARLELRICKYAIKQT